MPWREAVEPIPMRRIAVLALADSLRDVLVRIAGAGTVEIESAPETQTPDAAEALHRLQSRGIVARQPTLQHLAPSIAELEGRHAADLLAGEVDLSRHAAAAVPHKGTVALVGWTAARSIPALEAELGPLGTAIVELPIKPSMEPPTALPGEGTSSFTPLVNIYGTARYRDVDPTPFTAASFVLMFGMMFADAGEGLLLMLIGLFARITRNPALAPLRRVWAIPFWAGLVAAAFGVAYGEAFGPTGLLPALWLAPLQNPITLVGAGVVVGAVLLAISYLIGIINRYREEGLRTTLLAGSGVAGFLLFAGLASLALRVLLNTPLLFLPGTALTGLAIVLLFVGLLLEAGTSLTGVLQSIVELFTQIIRMAANAISFARLAAFGLVHAAMGDLVWKGTLSLWSGPLRFAAPLVFLVGTALAFALELLVAGIQALRLEYYELYSRIFAGEGRPFRPWQLPVLKEET